MCASEIYKYHPRFVLSLSRTHRCRETRNTEHTKKKDVSHKREI